VNDTGPPPPYPGHMLLWIGNSPPQGFAPQDVAHPSGGNDGLFPGEPVHSSSGGFTPELGLAAEALIAIRRHRELLSPG
jgi:hypothetical protein